MSIVNITQKILSIIPYKFRSKIKNIPVVKQIQASFQKAFLNNKTFIATISAGPAKGLVFPVEMPQDKGMWIGTWETEFSEALAAEIKPGNICYDIGSYKGYYAGIMALKGAQQIYLFEPMPKNIQKITEMIQLNQSLPLNLVEAAVSNSDGEISFMIMEEDTMGKLEQSTFQQQNKSNQKIQVKTLAIDSLVYQQGFIKPDFIKIDVEGAEFSVLQGAEKTLKEYKPVLMIEIHSKEIGKQCLEFLQSFYQTIYVLETGKHPREGNVPEICHYVIK
jgi:FkbM family methyltransferase